MNVLSMQIAGAILAWPLAAHDLRQAVTRVFRASVGVVEWAGSAAAYEPTSTQESSMKSTRLFAALLVAGLSGGAFAQSLQTIQQRDVNQQQRIETGLQDGSLNTREAARLEQDQRKVDKLEAHSLKDGKLSPAERTRIAAAENRASHDIHEARTNGVKGDALSTSSQRMQADVQRNVNQDKRISAGVKSGALDNQEVARLDAGQAQVDGKEARAGHNGVVGAKEQAGIQHAENKQSRRIHRLKTNPEVRPS
jgi:hypothetical protein